jgi:hypothetical protein
MSSVIEKVKSHYQAQIAGELKSFSVPEWQVDVFYRTTTPLKEEATIMKLSQEGKVIEALVETIIVKARNIDGSKMFNPVDRVFLLNEADAEVVIRVASQLNGVVSTLDEVEKN